MLLLHSDSVAHPENFKGEVLKKKTRSRTKKRIQKIVVGRG